MCEMCKTKILKARTGHISRTLKNYELDGQQFDDSLSGYAKYLMARGFGKISGKEKSTTTYSYCTAIADIAQTERMSFDSILNNVQRLVKDYDVGGKNERLGLMGNSSWRNSLKTLSEFAQYLEENSQSRSL